MVGVLFVCTGNICRSPTAEGVLLHKLAAEGLGDRVRVDSAGTDGWHVGDPPSGPAIEAARTRGYDISALRARQFEKSDFANFDLILAMDDGHLSRLSRMSTPESRGKIRMFLDFALGESGGVPDPYYGGTEDYEHMFDLVEGAMPGFIAALRRDYL